ncbi:hypothetical protein QJS10_CPB04g01897 [Acorus calamus]|uniref:Protein TIC 20 n=1 Tax=Acorus calamus TaxID=4465 RepID=A0AAV9F173_ACOCL|nr:hypothetical protein QJS10_CPB04g01897 [Acorus calamus]
MAALTLLRFVPLKPQPLRTVRSSPSTVKTKTPTLTIKSFSTSTVPATDRLISSAAYTLPLLNSLHYGRFLLSRSPIAASAFAPLLPIVSAYRSVPLASFVAFFALYLGVVRNPSFSRYVRFNSMQALVVDVMLSLPTLLIRVFEVPTRGVGLKVLSMGFDLVFVASAVCFLYSLVSCVLGRTPHIPVVAAAADRGQI